ncbi:hypothetical protein OBV_21790 [Oscillibacter valericigenes Sjm18-20]|nr:hypothetical protein OBV_21790 [Oscillibacter valericigenes Sjm18-20]
MERFEIDEVFIKIRLNQRRTIYAQKEQVAVRKQMAADGCIDKTANPAVETSFLRMVQVKRKKFDRLGCT